MMNSYLNDKRNRNDKPHRRQRQRCFGGKKYPTPMPINVPMNASAHSSDESEYGHVHRQRKKKRKKRQYSRYEMIQMNRNKTKRRTSFNNPADWSDSSNGSNGSNDPRISRPDLNGVNYSRRNGYEQDRTGSNVPVNGSNMNFAVGNWGPPVPNDGTAANNNNGTAANDQNANNNNGTAANNNGTAANNQNANNNNGTNQNANNQNANNGANNQNRNVPNQNGAGNTNFNFTNEQKLTISTHSSATLALQALATAEQRTYFLTAIYGMFAILRMSGESDHFLSRQPSINSANFPAIQVYALYYDLLTRCSFVLRSVAISPQSLSRLKNHRVLADLVLSRQLNLVCSLSGVSDRKHLSKSARKSLMVTQCKVSAEVLCQTIWCLCRNIQQRMNGKSHPSAILGTAIEHVVRTNELKKMYLCRKLRLEQNVQSFYCAFSDKDLTKSTFTAYKKLHVTEIAILNIDQHSSVNAFLLTDTTPLAYDRRLVISEWCIPADLMHFDPLDDNPAYEFLASTFEHDIFPLNNYTYYYADQFHSCKKLYRPNTQPTPQSTWFSKFKWFVFYAMIFCIVCEIGFAFAELCAERTQSNIEFVNGCATAIQTKDPMYAARGTHYANVELSLTGKLFEYELVPDANKLISICPGNIRIGDEIGIPDLSIHYRYDIRLYLWESMKQLYRKLTLDNFFYVTHCSSNFIESVSRNIGNPFRRQTSGLMWALEQIVSVLAQFSQLIGRLFQETATFVFQIVRYICVKIAEFFPNIQWKAAFRALGLTVLEMFGLGPKSLAYMDAQETDINIMTPRRVIGYYVYGYGRRFVAEELRDQNILAFIGNFLYNNAAAVFSFLINLVYTFCVTIYNSLDEAYVLICSYIPFLDFRTTITTIVHTFLHLTGFSKEALEYMGDETQIGYSLQRLVGYYVHGFGQRAYPDDYIAQYPVWNACFNYAASIFSGCYYLLNLVFGGVFAWPGWICSYIGSFIKVENLFASSPNPLERPPAIESKNYVCANWFTEPGCTNHDYLEPQINFMDLAFRNGMKFWNSLVTEDAWQSEFDMDYALTKESHCFAHQLSMIPGYLIHTFGTSLADVGAFCSKYAPWPLLEAIIHKGTYAIGNSIALLASVLSLAMDKLYFMAVILIKLCYLIASDCIFKPLDYGIKLVITTAFNAIFLLLIPLLEWISNSALRLLALF